MKFKQNKITFLKDNYNEVTGEIYYNVWKSFIAEYEDIRNKDVSEFTPEEIEGLVINVPSSSANTKNNVLSFINIYCEWAVMRGLININPCSAIDTDKIIKVNAKRVKSNLYSLEQTYRVCTKLKDNTPIFTWLPLLLARYGIMGANSKELINLKWENVDYTNKLIYITDEETGEITKQVPVDDKLLSYITMAKGTTSDVITYRGSNRMRVNYIDYGYVLKKRDNSLYKGSIQKITKQELYQDMRKAFKTDKIITLKDLYTSKLIEDLINIREERQLTGSDCYNVAKKYNPDLTRGGYVAVKREWESLTGEVVVNGNIAPENLKKGTKEYADKLRREFFGE